MTKEQLQILQHALGCDEYGRRLTGVSRDGVSRDYYITDNDAEMAPLVALNCIINCGSNTATGGMNCYRVTDVGKKAMREESPKPPKLTQSQRRYREWLSVGDALNCTFGEWLKMRSRTWYKEMRVD